MKSNQKKVNNAKKLSLLLLQAPNRNLLYVYTAGKQQSCWRSINKEHLDKSIGSTYHNGVKNLELCLQYSRKIVILRRGKKEFWIAKIHTFLRRRFVVIRLPNKQWGSLLRDETPYWMELPSRGVWNAEFRDGEIKLAEDRIIKQLSLVLEKAHKRFRLFFLFFFLED